MTLREALSLALPSHTISLALLLEATPNPFGGKGQASAAPYRVRGLA